MQARQCDPTHHSGIVCTKFIYNCHDGSTLRGKHMSSTPWMNVVMHTVKPGETKTTTIKMKVNPSCETQLLSQVAVLNGIRGSAC